MKKILAALLSVILILLPLAGCYNPPTVLSISGVDISNGLYLFFQLQAVSEATQKLGEASSGKPLYEQMIDDIPARDWINNRTIEVAQEYVFIEQDFVRAGASEDDYNYEVSMYESSIQSQWSQASYLYEKNGIGYRSFFSAYTNYIKSSHLFNTLYVADNAEFPVPKDEIKDYFIENYTYLDMIKIPLTGADGKALADAEKETLRNLTNEMRTSAESAAEDLEKVYQGDTNVGLDAAFDFYASSEGISDTDLDTKKSSMTTKNVVAKRDSTDYDAELLTALFAASTEGYGICETENTIYLYCRRDPLVYEPAKWEDYSSTIITLIRSETFTDYLTEKSRELPVTEDARARSYYSLDKVKTS